jgi:hypothetical protein
LSTGFSCWSAESGVAAKQAPRHLPGISEGAVASHRLSPEDLQRELLGFADRYRELIGQTSDEGVLRSRNPGMRVVFQATKTSYVSSAVSVVTGPRPLEALRDLLVMVSLQRMVWASGASGRIAPADAEPVARVLATLETEIYDLAARVVPAEAIAKLRSLIEQWRRENPEQHYVAFVRFQHLGTSSFAREVEEVISSGGFLAPVESVAREAHDARLLAERTLYLANRMPVLLEWQATLAYQRIVASPEAVGVLGDVQSYRAALEQLGSEVKELPARVAAERKALMSDLSERVANERAQTLRHLQALIRGEREALFAALSKGADSYGPIVGQFAATAAAMRDTVAGLERMTARTGGTAKADGEDLRRLHEISTKLAAAASNTSDIVVGLNSLLNSELRGLTTLDRMLAEHAQRLFLYAAALVLLLGVVLYIAVRAARRPENLIRRRRSLQAALSRHDAPAH